MNLSTLTGYQMDRVYLENMIKAFQRYGDAKFPSLYEESRAEKTNKLFQVGIGRATHRFL